MSSSLKKLFSTNSHRSGIIWYATKPSLHAQLWLRTGNNRFSHSCHWNPLIKINKAWRKTWFSFASLSFPYKRHLFARSYIAFCEHVVNRVGFVSTCFTPQLLEQMLSIARVWIIYILLGISKGGKSNILTFCSRSEVLVNKSLY